MEMALQLVDDDLVLEAALSLLDQHDGQVEDVMQSTASKKKKRRTRGYNPNRARDSEQKELLALSEQIPKLEKRLEAWKRRSSTTGKETDMLHLWKKLAMHERKTRENAQEENRRLRDLVRENAEVTTRNVQQLLQTRLEECPHTTTEHRPDPWPGPYRRMHALPVDPRDGNLFREMAESIGVVHRQVLQVYSTDGNAAQFPSAGKTHRRTFADKILPFDIDSVGAAAWQFFAHSFRRPTTRFYYHTDSHQSTELVSDDTVVEIFGEEHCFGQVLLDIKIKQIIRRYAVDGRVVVAWRALLRPEKFKSETLSNVVYEEKGALVIEPYTTNNASEMASIVHTWQMVTPDISEDAPCVQSELVQELTGYVFNSCRPGRAVLSMERTLCAQSMH